MIIATFTPLSSIPKPKRSRYIIYITIFITGFISLCTSVIMLNNMYTARAEQHTYMVRHDWTATEATVLGIAEELVSLKSTNTETIRWRVLATIEIDEKKYTLVSHQLNLNPTNIIGKTINITFNPNNLKEYQFWFDWE